MSDVRRLVRNSAVLGLSLSMAISANARADDGHQGGFDHATKILPSSVTGLFPNGVTAGANSDGSVHIVATGAPGSLEGQFAGTGGSMLPRSPRVTPGPATVSLSQADPEIQMLMSLAANGCAGGR